MKEIIQVTELNINETLKEGVVLLDFWAPWCGPCRAVAPVIDELAKDLKGKVKVCKVNTDEEQNIAIKFGIRSIPTFIFIKNGKVENQTVGACSKEKLIELLNEI